MIFWDFSIHIIDKRDRKYFLDKKWDNMWREQLRKSKSIFSYYYPHFWGKKPVSDEKAWNRYDLFWLTYWGTALFLLLTYIILK